MVLKLRDYREACGWSQQQLARALGVHASTLARYERGRRRVPLGILERISALLGVPVKALLGLGDHDAKTS
jgi:transcriptional regulator with XRE-family HTH domain